ncbi:MAG: glutamyl-tRNA reductase, partial [Gemmatimonadota bacterium]|nr:glutamyl-tRNA reductase [Gemmatimonadota bacterium]
MPLVVVGLSHRTAPIEIRERLALSRAELPGVLRQLVESGAATEAVVLSTCNRTEIYLSLFAEPQGVRAAHRLLSGRLDEAPAAVADRLYLHRDRAAAEHLFRVTAGLDSMVLGEAQIQGQVKDAYAAARETMSEAGPIAGSALHRLFQTALSVGGRIRSETEVGRGSASVSSAGVELAKKIFGSLRGRRVLVLGAGEMAQITLECLRAEGVRSAKVASRTLERAEEVARRCGAEAIEMEDVWRELAKVEIVISSTA